MSLYNKEELILDFIVTICGIYCLNENEAMRYLQLYSPKPISRRTYYNYKKKIYNNCSKSFNDINNDKLNDTKKICPEIVIDLSFMKSKALISHLLNIERKKLIQKGLKLNINLKEYDKLNYLPQYFHKLHNRSDILLDRSKKLIEESKSSQTLANTTIKDIAVPPNATIKAEYIRCGKDYCNRCKHGPYYYAYWKVGNKLKKKYLGRDFP